MTTYLINKFTSILRVNNVYVLPLFWQQKIQQQQAWIIHSFRLFGLHLHVLYTVGSNLLCVCVHVAGSWEAVVCSSVIL